MSSSETNMCTHGRHFRRPDVGRANRAYGWRCPHQPYQHMCTHLFRKTQNRLDAKVIYSMEFSLLRSHGYSLKAPMNCVIGVYINTSIRLF